MKTNGKIDEISESNIEEDYHRTIGGDVRSRFLPGTRIEIIRDVRPEARLKHVLFDFDGTLSLIREGWPEVMVAMMMEELRAAGSKEPEESIKRRCYEFVMRLNGKQTIYQMIHLAEEIRGLGGAPDEPLHYKEKYHRRLMEKIKDRRDSLRAGRAAARDYLVEGSLEMLAEIRSMGLPIYLASGTDEKYVLEEAALLGLDPYFGGHIYGAIDDYKSYSKKMVIDRILRVNGVAGSSMLGFGDGYVEIQSIKAVGGVAVAVASDEAGRSGRPDAWKRERLIGVGADIVIPDYRDRAALLAYLFRKE